MKSLSLVSEYFLETIHLSEVIGSVWCTGPFAYVRILSIMKYRNRSYAEYCSLYTNNRRVRQAHKIAHQGVLYLRVAGLLDSIFGKCTEQMPIFLHCTGFVQHTQINNSHICVELPICSIDELPTLKCVEVLRMLKTTCDTKDEIDAITCSR
jgi:hypothetical protein